MTQTAQAVFAPTYGGPEVLEVREVELPDPGPGQVAVEVRAAALNPIDHKLFGALMGDEDPDALPMRVGFEAAGVVTAVGADATGPSGAIEVGDEVICYRVEGAQASHLVLDASTVYRKPAGMSFEAASALNLAGVTAVHLLEATKVGRGDTILVHGASGGVGLLLVQLAKARGASVVGTASEASHLQLRAYGVRPVAYGEGLLDRVRDLAPAGYDAALDCVGTDEAVDVSRAVVADGDRIATIAAFGRAQSEPIKALGGGPGADPGTEVRDAARMQLVEAVEAGDLEVVVAHTYGLHQAADAHSLAKDGHPGGKIVLVP